MVLWFNYEEGGNNSMFSDLTTELPNLRLDTILDFWSNRLLGHTLSGQVRAGVKAKVMEEMERLPNEDLKWLVEHNEEALEFKLMQLVALLALTPEFQKR